jgi:hypothetical protein
MFLLLSSAVFSGCDRITPEHPAKLKAAELYEEVAAKVQLLYLEGTENSLEEAENAWRQLLRQLQWWDEDARSAASEWISKVEAQIWFAHSLRLKEVRDRTERMKLKFLKGEWRKARTRLQALLEILDFYERRINASDDIVRRWEGALHVWSSNPSSSVMLALAGERQRVVLRAAKGDQLPQLDGLDAFLIVTREAVQVLSYDTSASPEGAKTVAALWDRYLGELPAGSTEEAARTDLLRSLAEFERARADEMWPDPLPGSDRNRVPVLPPRR